MERTNAYYNDELWSLLQAIGAELSFKDAIFKDARAWSENMAVNLEQVERFGTELAKWVKKEIETRSAHKLDDGIDWTRGGDFRELYSHVVKLHQKFEVMHDLLYRLVSKHL